MRIYKTPCLFKFFLASRQENEFEMVFRPLLLYSSYNVNRDPENHNAGCKHYTHYFQEKIIDYMFMHIIEDKWVVFLIYLFLDNDKTYLLLM